MGDTVMFGFKIPGLSGFKIPHLNFGRGDFSDISREFTHGFSNFGRNHRGHGGFLQELFGSLFDFDFGSGRSHRRDRLRHHAGDEHHEHDRGGHRQRDDDRHPRRRRRADLGDARPEKTAFASFDPEIATINLSEVFGFQTVASIDTAPPRHVASGRKDEPHWTQTIFAQQG